MRVVALFVALTAGVLAQQPADLFNQAPPDVEQALRARITKFYELEREGKFRQADQFVAEESKDVYYGADKHRCTPLEITKITYSDEYKRAQVLVVCSTKMMMPLVGMSDVKMPVSSTWRVENGEWLWYVPPKSGRQSPWGELKAGPTEQGGDRTLPTGPDIATLQRQVRLDKEEVVLSATKGGAVEAIVTNYLPGSVKLQLEAPSHQGVSVTLDKSELKSKESARLTITCAAGAEIPSAPLDVRVRVQPTGGVAALKLYLQRATPDK